MKAMILAAGAGTRLRPLTLTKPKPMVPIVNEPNLGHILDKVSRAGITEIGMNLHSYPEQIEKFVVNGKKWNLKVHYSKEKTLLGTAGSLLPLKKLFNDDTFIVLSGDGVCDISLSEVVADHKRRGAMATIVLARSNERSELGFVQLNGSHEIRSFLEKPSWADVFSPYVNTGIYVLEPAIFRYFPKRGPFDFAKDLWPKLLAAKIPISGYIFDGYWCDIGNLKEYKRCHRDILEGKIHLNIAGIPTKQGIWMGKNVRLGKGVRLEAPLVIGHGATIEKNAKITANSIIGDRCHIQENAHIQECILWQHVTVAAKVHISGCILAEHAYIKESVTFYEGAIISATDK